MKLSRKNRNVISGILVGGASIFAVASYVKVPLEDLKSFLFSTALFFVAIVLLAALAVIAFKGLQWLKRQIFPGKDRQSP